MCCKLPEYSRILLGRVELVVVVVVVVGSDRLSGNLYRERERERATEEGDCEIGENCEIVSVVSFVVVYSGLQYVY